MKRAAALSIKRTTREKLFSGRLEKGKNNLFPTKEKKGAGGDVSLYLRASAALRTCHLFRVIFFFSSRPKLAAENGLTRGQNRNEICWRETLFSGYRMC